MKAANPGFTAKTGSAVLFKTIILIDLIKPVETGFNRPPD